MKKINFLIASAVASLFISYSNAQENSSISPYSFTHTITSEVPLLTMPEHDFTTDIAYAEQFEKNGNFPLIARHFDINSGINNSGQWTQLSNGDRVWRLRLKSNNAIATCLFFDNFYLPEGSTLHVYSPDHKQIFGSYTELDNQGNFLFSTEFIKGEEQIIEYFEPAAVKGQGDFRITSLAHQYRELAMADDCEVNINCTPEGDNWQDEKKGIVRILVKVGSSSGFCTGSLINNTALDCKRYILTAFHCGVDASSTDYNGWKFYFNYETATCTGGDGGPLNNVFTGCTKIADADDNGGDFGSDFLLLQMSATTHPAWWSNVYWNGWNKTTAAPLSGSICIHHPAGSNKKISTTTGTGTSSTWGGVSGTHWRVKWAGTTNGWGVTEGGSSGSPLFNANGQIIGTLTGGQSYCNSVQANGQNQPDSYGKMSYHWTSNGTSNNQQLKPWLDPLNSGVNSLNGGTNPCNGVGINEINKATSDVLSVYPNPNNGTFTVNLTLNDASGAEINVYNYTGQKITYKKIENSNAKTQTIDLTGNVAGLYFVHLNTPEYSEVRTVVITK